MNNSKKNKKLKKQYRDSYKVSSIFLDNYFYEYFPNMKSSCHKNFSKHQERSYFQMHELEYRKEYGLRIRGRRGGCLEEAWDDYPSYVEKVSKSWKHNSKRKNQYYKEK